MRVLLINSGLSATNWGLRVASESLMQAFVHASGSTVVEVETLSNDFLYLKSGIRPSLIPRFLQNILHPQVLESTPGRRIFRARLNVPKTSDQLDQCSDELLSNGRSSATKLKELIIRSDVVVFQGEGSAYNNNYSARLGFFILWVAKMKFNKRIAFLNGSLGVSLDYPILGGFASRIERVADVFAVREPVSQRMFERMAQRKIDMVPDSAFLFDFENAKLINQSVSADEEYVVVSGGMLPILEKSGWDSSPFSVMCSELQNRGHQLVFLGIDPEDMKLRHLAEKLGCRFLGPEKHHDEILNVISRSQALISGRYHHLIFALAQGVPVVPFATTSQKNRGLLELYDGLVPRLLDPTSLWCHQEAAIAALESQLRDGLKLRQKIGGRSKYLIEQASADYIRLIGRLIAGDQKREGLV